MQRAVLAMVVFLSCCCAGGAGYAFPDAASNAPSHGGRVELVVIVSVVDVAVKVVTSRYGSP